MSTDLDRDGDFRVECQEYGLFNAGSGSVAVNMKFRVLEQFNPEIGEWDDWREYDVTVDGSFWIIKKPKEGQTNGDLNDRQIDALVQHCGWDAKLKSIAEGTWTPTNCQVNVRKDDYQSGRLKRDVFRAAFINGYDSTPGGGGLGNVTAEDAGALDAKWGAKMRAVAANAKAPQKPAGKPLSPAKKTPAKETVPPSDEAGERTAANNDVPF